MKRNTKLALFGAGLLALVGVGFGLTVTHTMKANAPLIALAEEETPETLPCQVTIDPVKHGSVSVDISEGNIGDICTVTAKHDILYKVESVSVNGTALVESETTSGEFTFALVEGENKITASFIVDEELCGALTAIVQEATEKDWTNLFSVENAIVLVKWVIDGGVLIAMVRYYIKDKKLANKLEHTTKETLKSVIPEVTKDTVLTTIKTVITPMFEETKADYIEIMKGLNVFAKCFALSQDGSADSKRAILDELSGLKIGDLETIGEVKKYIEDMVERHTKAYEETLAAIKELGNKQDAYIGEPKIEEKESSVVEEVIKEKKQAIE